MVSVAPFFRNEIEGAGDFCTLHVLWSLIPPAVWHSEIQDSVWNNTSIFFFYFKSANAFLLHGKGYCDQRAFRIFSSFWSLFTKTLAFSNLPEKKRFDPFIGHLLLKSMYNCNEPGKVIVHKSFLRSMKGLFFQGTEVAAIIGIYLEPWWFEGPK